MKRFFCALVILLAMFFLVSVDPMWGGTITLLSPNGGTNWGLPHTITWTSLGLDPCTRIKFDLFYGVGPIDGPEMKFVGIMAQGISVGSGTYDWNGIMVDGSTPPAGENYWIVIQTMSSGENYAEDASESSFFLADTPSTRFGIKQKLLHPSKFTIDDKEVFLFEISYFNPYPLDTSNDEYRAFLEKDLESLKKKGINCIRVSVNNSNFDWGYELSNPDIYTDDFELYSAFKKSQDGSHYVKNEPYLQRLKTLIDICNKKSMIIDFTFFICSPIELGFPDEHSEGYKQVMKCMPGSLELAQNFVNKFTSEFKRYKNWYWDVYNEWDAIGKHYPVWCGKSDFDCILYRTIFPLLSEVKSVDPERLCTASCCNPMISNRTEFLCNTNLDFIALHSGFESKKAYDKYDALNSGNKPIHFQEPSRRGYDFSYPIASEFLQDLSSIDQVAAGWCLHNFLMLKPGEDATNWKNWQPKCAFLNIIGQEDTFYNTGMLLYTKTGFPEGQLDDQERLVLDRIQTYENPLNSFFITATARDHGAISPSGNVVVSQGGSQTFTITVDAGYSIWKVIVDGVDKGAISSYTFSNIQAYHSIIAIFADPDKIPEGAIVPFNSDTATIPSGWCVWSSADEKYIVGAGRDYQVGANSSLGLTISPTTEPAGQHNGVRVNAIGAGTANWVGNSYAGNHRHALTMTYTPATRQTRLIRSNMILPEFPVDAVVFSKSDLGAPLSKVYTDDNKFFKAGGSLSSADASFVVSGLSTAGAHTHGTKTGTGIYQAGSGCKSVPETGDHVHPFTATFNEEHIKKAILTAWSNASAFAPVSGAIVMYEGMTPPPGWALCDGNNGTIDLRDHFVYIGSSASQGGVIGTDTLAVDVTISQIDWEHDHQVAGALAPATSGQSWHGSRTVPHSHSMGPIPYVPPYYALVFIQKI